MKTDCTNCVHHDLFWKGSGCSKKAAMEPCEFEPKESQKRTETA